MKTSELIKKVEEFGNGLSVVITNGIVMLFADNEQTLICKIDEKIITTYKETFVVKSLVSNAIELMFEYAKTPLEEREEEKKYRLKMPKEFNAFGLYVLKQECIENYFFKSCQFENDQSIFTQKEIDDMPFDTNFFTKEEVK